MRFLVGFRDLGVKMSLFKFILINYFSPVYLILRIGWLWTAFLLWLVGIGSKDKLFLGISLCCAFIGIKPWKVGMTVGDVIRKINSYRDDER